MVKTAHDVIRNYQPQPELAEVKSEPATGWYILLSPAATVIELAVLMAGLGCKVRADHTSGGEFCVRPLDPTAPQPSTQLIHDILTAGFGDRLPMLLCKQAG